MKLAITMIPGSGRISPVFETAEYLQIVRLCPTGKYRVVSVEQLPESEPEKIAFLQNGNVKMLICGAVSNETLTLLRNIDLRVVPFVSGEWCRVLDAILEKKESLPENFIMPGCCRHHRRCCRNQVKESAVDTF